jgi:serine/threonine protein kinase
MVPVLLDDQREGRPVGALFSPSERKEHYSMFRIYRPKEIIVPLHDNSTALPSQPDKVSIRGEQVCFFKRVMGGDIPSTIREFSAYAKIQSAGFGPEVFTSRLYGVVEDEETSRVIGLLLTYIDFQNQTLYCAKRHPRFGSLKKKWLGQIVSTLQSLHAHQITWGDGKPANVLIDIYDDAYLIDFGGGYTQGWVDKELSNTMEGDLQALERITNYLSE